MLHVLCVTIGCASLITCIWSLTFVSLVCLFVLQWTRNQVLWKRAKISLSVHQLDDPQCDSAHMGPQRTHLLHTFDFLEMRTANTVLQPCLHPIWYNRPINAAPEFRYNRSFPRPITVPLWYIGDSYGHRLASIKPFNAHFEEYCTGKFTVTAKVLVFFRSGANMQNIGWKIVLQNHLWHIQHSVDIRCIN